MGGAIAVAGGTVLINGVEFIDNKAKGGNGGNAKSPVGSSDYAGAGGGSIFGGGGSRVNWGWNYTGRAGGFGGGGSGGLDYQENNSYGGTGGFGGGGGGGGTATFYTSFWSPSFLPALRDKQVYMGVLEVRGKLCPTGKEVVMVEAEVEVEAWEERYLLSQVM